jgi:hypothetical protein
MYIVRDKKTKEILHTNMAPLSQNLSEHEIYYYFDSSTMETGKTDLSFIPENYKIDSSGYITESSLQELLDEGKIKISPEEKIVGDQVVEKSISEKIKEGLLILPPTQKLVVSGDKETIIEKTPSELIAENLYTLSPTEKIVGTGDDEKIVQKSLEEQFEEGLLKLGPHQRIVDNTIVTYTLQEMFDKGFIDLTEYKKQTIEEYSMLSFTIRDTIIPEYKLVNSGLGIYDESQTAEIKSTIQAFRDEFQRLQSAVEQAATVQEILTIKENYPRTIVKVEV